LDRTQQNGQCRGQEGRGTFNHDYVTSEFFRERAKKGKRVGFLCASLAGAGDTYWWSLKRGRRRKEKSELGDGSVVVLGGEGIVGGELDVEFRGARLGGVRRLQENGSGRSNATTMKGELMGIAWTIVTKGYL